MPNKKRSKHHAIANAQKRTKRNKKKFYNRHILPVVLAKQVRKEDKRRRKALSDRLKKDLKKIEVISKTGLKVVKKTGVAVKKGGEPQKKEG